MSVYYTPQLMRAAAEQEAALRAEQAATIEGLAIQKAAADKAAADKAAEKAYADLMAGQTAAAGSATGFSSPDREVTEDDLESQRIAMARHADAQRIFTEKYYQNGAQAWNSAVAGQAALPRIAQVPKEIVDVNTIAFSLGSQIGSWSQGWFNPYKLTPEQIAYKAKQEARAMAATAKNVDAAMNAAESPEYLAAKSSPAYIAAAASASTAKAAADQADTDVVAKKAAASGAQIQCDYATKLVTENPQTRIYYDQRNNACLEALITGPAAASAAASALQARAAAEKAAADAAAMLPARRKSAIVAGEEAQAAANQKLIDSITSGQAQNASSAIAELSKMTGDLPCTTPVATVVKMLKDGTPEKVKASDLTSCLSLFTPDQMQYAPNDILAKLSDTQVAGLSIAQIKALSNYQLSGMTPEQLSALTYDQANVIDEIQTSILSDDQKNAIAQVLASGYYDHAPPDVQAKLRESAALAAEQEKAAWAIQEAADTAKRVSAAQAEDRASEARAAQASAAAAAQASAAAAEAAAAASAAKVISDSIAAEKASAAAAYTVAIDEASKVSTDPAWYFTALAIATVTNPTEKSGIVVQNKVGAAAANAARAALDAKAKADPNWFGDLIGTTAQKVKETRAAKIIKDLDSISKGQPVEVDPVWYSVQIGIARKLELGKNPDTVVGNVIGASVAAKAHDALATLQYAWFDTTGYNNMDWKYWNQSEINDSYNYAASLCDRYGIKTYAEYLARLPTITASEKVAASAAASAASAAASAAAKKVSDDAAYAKYLSDIAAATEQAKQQIAAQKNAEAELQADIAAAMASDPTNYVASDTALKRYNIAACNSEHDFIFDARNQYIYSILLRNTAKAWPLPGDVAACYDLRGDVNGMISKVFFNAILPKIPPKQIQYLSKQLISSLDNSQLNTFTIAQLQALTDLQMAALSDAQFSALSADKQNSISARRVAKQGEAALAASSPYLVLLALNEAGLVSTKPTLDQYNEYQKLAAAWRAGDPAAKIKWDAMVTKSLIIEKAIRIAKAAGRPTTQADIDAVTASEAQQARVDAGYGSLPAPVLNSLVSVGLARTVATAEQQAEYQKIVDGRNNGDPIAIAKYRKIIAEVEALWKAQDAAVAAGRQITQADADIAIANADIATEAILAKEKIEAFEAAVLPRIILDSLKSVGIYTNIPATSEQNTAYNKLKDDLRNIYYLTARELPLSSDQIAILDTYNTMGYQAGIIEKAGNAASDAGRTVTRAEIDTALAAARLPALPVVTGTKPVATGVNIFRVDQASADKAAIDKADQAYADLYARAAQASATLESLRAQAAQAAQAVQAAQAIQAVQPAQAVQAAQAAQTAQAAKPVQPVQADPALAAAAAMPYAVLVALNNAGINRIQPTNDQINTYQQLVDAVNTGDKIAKANYDIIQAETNAINKAAANASAAGRPATQADVDAEKATPAYQSGLKIMMTALKAAQAAPAASAAPATPAQAPQSLDQLASFTPQHISALSIDQLESLTSTQITKLSVAQISALTPAQAIVINPMQAILLQNSQAATLNKATKLPSAQLSDAIGTFQDIRKSVISTLGPTADTPTYWRSAWKEALSTAAQAAQTVQVAPEVITVNPMDTIASFTTAQIKALTIDDLQSLTPTQLAKMSLTQIKALSALQAIQLNPMQRSSLSTSQIKALNTAAGLSASQFAEATDAFNMIKDEITPDSGELDESSYWNAAWNAVISNPTIMEP